MIGLVDHMHKDHAEYQPWACSLCHKYSMLLMLGLVDHMHKDHAEYQPWACSLCPVKTAFVKTLYRHLKQALTSGPFISMHLLGGSDCAVLPNTQLTLSSLKGDSEIYQIPRQP